MYVNSTVYNKLVELLSYLVTLNSTYRVAVWYGWKPSTVPLNTWCNTTLLKAYLDSLPPNVRGRYVVWIDMSFDDYVNECGVPGLLNSMGLPHNVHTSNNINNHYNNDDYYCCFNGNINGNGD
ncbi:MAG: hypothetical protein RXO26_07490 [Caldivirga sp.]